MRIWIALTALIYILSWLWLFVSIKEKEHPTRVSTYDGNGRVQRR